MRLEFFLVVIAIGLAYARIDSDEDDTYQLPSPQHIFSTSRFHRSTHHKKQRHHIHVPKLHHVKGSSRQFLTGFRNVGLNGFNGIDGRVATGLTGFSSNCMNPCGNSDYGLNGINGVNGLGADINGLNGGLNAGLNGGLNAGLNGGLNGLGTNFDGVTTGFNTGNVLGPMQCCDAPRRIRTKNVHRVIVASNQLHANNPLHYTMPGKSLFEPTRHVYDNSPIRHVASKFRPTYEETGTSQIVAPNNPNLVNALQNACQPPVFTSGCGANVPVPSSTNICAPPYLTGNACNPANPTYGGDLSLNGPGFDGNLGNGVVTTGVNNVGGAVTTGTVGTVGTGCVNVGSVGVTTVGNGCGPIGTAGTTTGVVTAPTLLTNPGGFFPGVNGGLNGGAYTATMSEKCLPPVTCGPLTEAKDDSGVPAVEAKEGADLALPKNPFLRRYIPKLLGTIFQNPSRRHNMKHRHHHSHHKHTHKEDDE